MRTRRNYRAVVVVLIIGAAAFAVAREYLANRLTVVNESGQAIKQLSITVGKRPLSFEHLPAGGTAAGQFWIESDDGFQVDGQLADATPIRDNVGYVTHGMCRERAEFTVKPGGKVVLEQH
jgi:hypothetical protein